MGDAVTVAVTGGAAGGDAEAAPNTPPPQRDLWSSLVHRGIAINQQNMVGFNSELAWQLMGNKHY